MDWIVSERGEADHLVVPSGPLVGPPGSDFVALQLGVGDPQSAIREIQERGSVRDPRVAPRLGLVRALGQSQTETFRKVLETARERLLQMIPTLPQDRLELLLEASFPFIGIPELKAVPVRVLSYLRPVPRQFLLELSQDQDLLSELPISVQRQVWEVDEGLLERQVMATIEGYQDETATRIRALDMDECLDITAGMGAWAGAAGPRKMPSLARHMLRKGSSCLRRLLEVVGASPTVYQALVRFCAALFRNSESEAVGVTEAAVCTLRVQLLLALNDRGVSSVTSTDPLLPLAVALDASLQSRHISPRNMAAMQAFFRPFQRSPLRPATAGAPPSDTDAPASAGVRLRVKFGAGVKRGRNGKVLAGPDDLSGPAGNGQVLFDAAMALRDPSALHLVLHELVRGVMSTAAGVAAAIAPPAPLETPGGGDARALEAAPWDAPAEAWAGLAMSRGGSVAVPDSAAGASHSVPGSAAPESALGPATDAGGAEFGGFNAGAHVGSSEGPHGPCRVSELWDPWESTRTLFLTQLAQLGLGAREMLREGRPAYLNPDPVVVTQGLAAIVQVVVRSMAGLLDMAGGLGATGDAASSDSVGESAGFVDVAGDSAVSGRRGMDNSYSQQSDGDGGGASTGGGTGPQLPQSDTRGHPHSGVPGTERGRTSTDNGSTRAAAGAAGDSPPSGAGEASGATLDAMTGPELAALLASLCVRHSVVLHTTFVACLERLASLDRQSSLCLLSCLEEVAGILGLTSRGPQSDWAPFAATLAKRLHQLVGSGYLMPEDPLWRLAFERVLVPCTHLDPQVHEEALRVLLQLVGRADPQDLARCVGLVMATARHPRPSEAGAAETSLRPSVRATGGYPGAGMRGAGAVVGASSESGSSEAEDGPTSAYRPRPPAAGTDAREDDMDLDAPAPARPGVRRGGGVDGVRTIYAMLAQRLKDEGHSLEGSVPQLASYLEAPRAGSGRGGGRGGRGAREDAARGPEGTGGTSD